MNILDQLTSDHRKVDQIIAELKTGTEVNVQLLTQLEREIAMHTHIEESIFYPELQNYPETSELISHSFEEHQEVDEILVRLRSEADMDALLELEERISHHVEEEETNLFPKASQVLGEGRLIEMGRRMQEVKTAGIRAA